MKKKCFFFIFCILFCFFISSQEVIAKKELITKVTIGALPTQIIYYTSNDGFFSPGPPLIDDNGRIWFIPNGKENVIIFVDGRLTASTFPIGSTVPQGPQNYPASSQQGRFGFSWVPNEFIMLLEKSITLRKIHPNKTIIIPIPSGSVYQYSDYYQHYQIASIEYKPNIYSMEKAIKREYVVRNTEETRTWLSTQPGGFSIGDDGLLYRNGLLWSVTKPVDETHGWEYIGRLASGHFLWDGGGMRSSPNEFLVTDSYGHTELIIKLPWMVQSGEKVTEDKIEYLFDFGVGPWGELYCLLPPDFKLVGKEKDGAGGFLPIYEPDPSGSAELVVVRNHLKYFGRLNDDKVRLRKEARTSSAVVGTYPNKTGFRILETGTKKETIGGKTDVWYKVRLLDGTEGWFFGAFVHNLYDGPNGNPPPWPNVPDW